MNIYRGTAVRGGDPIHGRPGFAEMLERIENCDAQATIGCASEGKMYPKRLASGACATTPHHTIISSSQSMRMLTWRPG